MQARQASSKQHMPSQTNATTPSGGRIRYTGNRNKSSCLLSQGSSRCQRPKLCFRAAMGKTAGRQVGRVHRAPKQAHHTSSVIIVHAAMRGMHMQGGPILLHASDATACWHTRTHAHIVRGPAPASRTMQRTEVQPASDNGQRPRTRMLPRAKPAASMVCLLPHTPRRPRRLSHRKPPCEILLLDHHATSLHNLPPTSPRAAAAQLQPTGHT